MTSKDIRNTFLDFFKSKDHQIVRSAPMVTKDDPTLMFTNAGMNQFKDIFLGGMSPEYSRATDTQKCLRVSGKHNDLDEVGHDTYHHTMFEMLGNWSFDDYFKKDAIAWAWELLTDVYGIDANNLYVTIFGGDKSDNLPEDEEARQFWSEIIPDSRIISGNKKDNFWEMGETGPCGPCSEIHIDLRDEHEKSSIPGSELINKDHPEVIEIWNLVFIEFNRVKSGELKKLPSRHIDTGMGFERLCMVLQNKKSNYDTDVFQPIIQKIAELSGKKYGKSVKDDIAMRVMADHLRAVSFAIADGQLPSNTSAGYVIRRILRRAVRYGFTFLNFKEATLYKLVPVLSGQMKEVFPEVEAQQKLIMKVINEEENTFLRTLSQGIKKFDQYVQDNKSKKTVDGAFAFELFDTYGFPVDLTNVMARENEMSVDMTGFKKGLETQKNRSRNAAKTDASDWTVMNTYKSTVFTGYEQLESESRIIKYRKLKTKKEQFFEIVLDVTPFYAESGGQAGDTGTLNNVDENIKVINTVKQNNQIVHIATKMFKEPEKIIHAKVDQNKRLLTANNHSATHLLHAALKKVLGDHVEQKGSYVDYQRLRFDFSHFAKVSDEEIRQIEKIVNEKIRENIESETLENIPLDEAKQMGAAALFGEKYEEKVRVICFDKSYSIELCGGTHVRATGQIGTFKIISEAAIAAGIRRIEAVTGETAENFINKKLDELVEINGLLKNQKNTVAGIQKLIEENSNLTKTIKKLEEEKVSAIENQLKNEIVKMNGINFLAKKLEINAAAAKNLAFSMAKEIPDLFLIIGTVQNNKANLTLMISESLVKSHQLNAGNIIKEIAKEIKGGGGGQPHYATAGGKNIQGIDKAFQRAKKIISD